MCHAIAFAQSYLLQAISAQAYGRAISSSGFKLLEKLRDCATRLEARLSSSCGRSLACVGTKMPSACSTGRLFIAAMRFKQGLDGRKAV